MMAPDADAPKSGGTCPNCSAELTGPYCAACGQRQLDFDRPFREIGAEAMESFLSFDTRIVRTLWPLISRPGFLTVEFMAGRRARYVHPFKLYFAICVALFIGVAISGRSMVTISDTGDEPVTVEEIEGTASAEPAGKSPGEAGGPVEEAPASSTGFTVATSDDDDSLLARALAPLMEVAANDPDRLNRIFSDRLAKTVVILVPVFALLVRLLYRRSSYITDLVFSLHLHSFAFLALLTGISLDFLTGASQDRGAGNAVAVVAIAVYTFLALRRVQGQGRLMTAAKMFVLLVGYLVALIATMILTLAITAILI